MYHPYFLPPLYTVLSALDLRGPDRSITVVCTEVAGLKHIGNLLKMKLRLTQIVTIGQFEEAKKETVMLQLLHVFPFSIYTNIFLINKLFIMNKSYS